MVEKKDVKATVKAAAEAAKPAEAKTEAKPAAPEMCIRDSPGCSPGTSHHTKPNRHGGAGPAGEEGYQGVFWERGRRTWIGVRVPATHALHIRASAVLSPHR